MTRKITVSGRIGPRIDEDDRIVEYIAASHPDSRASFSGSGLPFANSVQAFSTTTTKGVLELTHDTQDFKVTINEPNSYYVDLGTTLIEPSLYVRYKSGGKHITERFVIGKSISYRTLTYPTITETLPRKGPEFYQMTPNDIAARTQEQILYDSEYTGRYQDRFWGQTPPN